MPPPTPPKFVMGWYEGHVPLTDSGFVHPSPISRSAPRRFIPHEYGCHKRHADVRCPSCVRSMSGCITTRMTITGTPTETLKVETLELGEVTALRRGETMIIIAPYREIDAELLDIYDWIGHEYQLRTIAEIRLDGVSRMIQITLV